MIIVRIKWVMSKLDQIETDNDSFILNITYKVFMISNIEHQIKVIQTVNKEIKKIRILE